MEENKLYIDEPCVVSFHIGEFGWFLQDWQGYLRYLKNTKYQNRKFILFTNPDLHCLVKDFIAYTIDLPEWFYDLKLDTDCYEAVLPNSEAGSLTPPDVYSGLITYFRQFYNNEKAIEIFPPRGCNRWMDSQPQSFIKFKGEVTINLPEIPIMVVFPRGRTRAAERNVPEFVWKELVDELKKTFIVVLGGTPSGSFLSDYPEDDRLINLISYKGEDKLELLISYLNSALCSISSQSGPTHLSLLSGCNCYIIGHEKERHTVYANRLGVPTSFRYVTDYRAIDAQTIISDIKNFMEALLNHAQQKKELINRPSLRTLMNKKDLIGVEIGVSDGANAFNMLENLNIKKLYLVDPYKNYAQFQKQEEWEKVAHELIDTKYKDKVEWIRLSSEEAVSKIPDNLDFVYIDGDHSYEGVKLDTELYYPKVKINGLVAGHDAELPRIKKAIIETLPKGYSINCEPCQDCKPLDWWIIKQDLLNVDETILAQSSNMLAYMLRQRTY